jgi:methylmalonyl-CoA epimerase
MSTTKTPIKIDHIGVAVKSLSAARTLFEQALGIKCAGREEVPSQRVRVEFYPMGDTRIECLEPTSDDSPIAKFLERSGEGIHHIAILVPNVAQALQQAQEQGIRLIDEAPRLGAEGAMIAFLHPKSTHGVLIELIEEKQ